jgi:hypothetical protein
MQFPRHAGRGHGKWSSLLPLRRSKARQRLPHLDVLERGEAVGRQGTLRKEMRLEFGQQAQGVVIGDGPNPLISGG